MKKILLPLLVAAVALGPGAARAQQAASRSGIDVENFDTSVRPQDDFYRYVNGTWLKQTEIPGDKSNYGSFTALADQAEIDLRALIEEAAAAQTAPGSEMQQIGDFYRSFLDTARVAALGLQPIAAELARIDAVEGRDALVRYLGESQRLGLWAPFGFYVGQDARNAAVYVPYVTQAGLGLPDRDFYFDDRFASIREAYAAHIERMLGLAGLPAAADAAQGVVAFETRLARNHWDRVRNRDANATYNPYDFEGARALTPGFDWAAFFDAAGVKNLDAFVLRQPSYFQAVDTMLVEVPVADWKTYLQYRLIARTAPYLSPVFAGEHFDFYSRTLSGIEQMPPRWKQAVMAMDELVGELIGKQYVARHFKPEAKARMDELVRNLRAAFALSIDELDWMDAPTKAAAKEKLDQFTFKIGYPDRWKDYSALVVRPDDLYGNVRRAGDLAYERMIARPGQPVDRSEWFMTPQTVNAYYSSRMNEVVFPAAILQPPFFNLEADDAVNYGAIGAVIGHEFGHGFDDQGSKSDGAGNLRDWWSASSKQEFERRAKMLTTQYDAFSPIDGMHVNGAFTLGENIGDLGGLTIAHKAYHLSLDGEEAPVIDGFTGDQRFFLGWGQIWRRKYRDDELKRRLVTDPHAPSEYRANGIVANLPAFYEAFGVKEGDTLYRPEAERVKIW